MKKLLLVSSLFLFGCASQRTIVRVTCFPKDSTLDQPTLKKTAVLPIISVKGTVIFYDPSGTMHSISDSNCGVSQ